MSMLDNIDDGAFNNLKTLSWYGQCNKPWSQRGTHKKKSARKEHDKRGPDKTHAIGPLAYLDKTVA
ncbi:unnamed protein product [Dovyalis caffra]|uniref:Uncharacterized protein n=1 Tax=Dovyalis caffra TaxID=77055 RepID=A0AAV1R104_9ROSI|nr:unnamed protein product [Dovyalis caffra]